MKKMATQKTPPWFQSLTKSHTPNIVTVHVVIDLALLALVGGPGPCTCLHSSQFPSKLTS